MTRANYTVSQLADRLQVSEAHVYNLIKRGELKSIRVGRSIRIPLEQVTALERGMAETVGSRAWTFTNPWSRA